MIYFIITSTKNPFLFMENVNYKEVITKHFQDKNTLDFICSVVENKEMPCMTKITSNNVTVWKMDDTVISLPVYPTIFFLFIEGKPSNTYGNYASYVLRCFGEDYGLDRPNELEGLYEDACYASDGMSSKSLNFSQGGTVRFDGIAIKENNMYF